MDRDKPFDETTRAALARLGRTLPLIERPRSIPVVRGASASAIDAADARGCPIGAVRARLRAAGLRPTRQRLLLGWLLFGKGRRHVSAELLFEEATRAKGMMSLATVYNTLRQFTEAGLLRQVPAGGGKAYFDTRIDEHQHFLVEGEDTIFDVADGAARVETLPEPPPGFAIAGVDVIVRLRRLNDG